MNIKRFRIQVAIRIGAILVTGLGAMFLWLSAEVIWAAILAAIVSLLLSIAFTRYLVKIKTDLYDFLNSFSKGDFRARGTSKMLKHSKDDLNYVYHKVMSSLQDYMGERESEAESFRSVFDNIRTGVICFDSATNIILINRYTRNLLQNPHLKNLSGLERVNPVLANYLIKLKPGTHAYITVEIENVPHELFLFAEEFTNSDEKFRVVTILNLKKEFRREEVHAFDRLMQSVQEALLQNKTDLQDGLKEYLELITNGKPKLTKCKVSDLFTEACSVFSGEPFGNIQCTSRLSNEDLWITADKEMLKRVLLLLLTNAAESIQDSKKGEIELIAQLDLGCDVQIVVRDNGEGVQPGDQDLIFVPFFSTRKKNRGMGLAIANKMMDLMDGLIHMKSSPGKGSEFILTFRS